MENEKANYIAIELIKLTSLLLHFGEKFCSESEAANTGSSESE